MRTRLLDLPYADVQPGDVLCSMWGEARKRITAVAINPVNGVVEMRWVLLATGEEQDATAPGTWTAFVQREVAA